MRVRQKQSLKQLLLGWGKKGLKLALESRYQYLSGIFNYPKNRWLVGCRLVFQGHFLLASF